MAQTLPLLRVAFTGPWRVWLMAEQINGAVEALEARDAAEAAMLAAGRAVAEDVIEETVLPGA